MRSAGPPRVVGVSYLAAATLLRVRRYPAANYGAEVVAREHALAADGPMVAASLAAFGLPATLIANGPGTDPPGRRLRDALDHAGIQLVAPTVDRPTAEIVVISDDAGNRAWFPFLPQVTDAIRAVLAETSVDHAALVYVDGYRVIEAAAIDAIQTAQRLNAPVMVNLGGDPLSPPLQQALRQGVRVACIQTNLDEDHAAQAGRLAEKLTADTNAELAVVTTGARGAVARTNGQTWRASAYDADVRHLHGAGAAFSAGLIYGLLAGRHVQAALDLACAHGSLRCERSHTLPWPPLQEVETFAANRKRLA